MVYSPYHTPHANTSNPTLPIRECEAKRIVPRDVSVLHSLNVSESYYAFFRVNQGEERGAAIPSRACVAILVVSQPLLCVPTSRDVFRVSSLLSGVWWSVRAQVMYGEGEVKGVLVVGQVTAIYSECVNELVGLLYVDRWVEDRIVVGRIWDDT